MDLRRLETEHVFDKIFREFPWLIIVERAQRLPDLGAAQGEAIELERGRPPLGAGVDRPHLLRADREIDPGRKEFGDFLGREAKIVRAQEGRLIVDNQARQPERRNRARSNKDAYIIRYMIEKFGKELEQAGFFERLKFVEEQRRRAS